VIVQVMAKRGDPRFERLEIRPLHRLRGQALVAQKGKRGEVVVGFEPK
jgi:hypothetical protein